jgi:excinuclease UvrABC helicase subunit UvrB
VPEIPDAGAVRDAEDDPTTWPTDRLKGEIARTRADMLLAANELRFEEATTLRDRLKELEDVALTR